jgi:hypothetical protein
MLPDTSQVSAISFCPLIPLMHVCSNYHCLAADGRCQCRQIGPADASVVSRRPRRAVVGAGPGEPREGEENPEVGVPRPAQ